MRESRGVAVHRSFSAVKQLRIRFCTPAPAALPSLAGYYLANLCSLSRSGLIAYASSTDCVGPIASTVADVGALLGAVAGDDRGGDSTALQRPVPDYTRILKEVRYRDGLC